MFSIVQGKMIEVEEGEEGRLVVTVSKNVKRIAVLGMVSRAKVHAF